jgi:acyl dehydratase
MARAFQDYSIGARSSRRVVFTAELVAAFADLVDDHAPVHASAEHARAMGYDGPIVHGLLVGSMYSKLLGTELPGENSVIMKLSFEMLKPVRIGDAIDYNVEVTALSESTQAITLALSAHGAAGLVNRGSALCLFRARA